MAIMAELVTRRLNRALESPDLGQIMTLLLVGYAVALVAATYFVTAWLLRMPEVTVTLGRLRAISGRIPVLGPLAR
jgi:hypothetical protein